MKVTIVAVAGKARSGKDSFCSIANDILWEKDNDIEVNRFAFGDKVKEVAFKMGWNGDKDENGRTGLQMIGDGARNLFDPYVWIQKTLKDIVNYCTSEKLIGERSEVVVFVTDCRYPNEIIALKNLSEAMGWKFHSLYISRDADNGLTEEQKENSSESALDSYVGTDFFNGHVFNNWTFEEYKIAVKDALELMGII